jgi:hypothetical protein
VMKRSFLPAGIVALLLLLFLDYRNFHNPGRPFFENLAAPVTTNSITDYNYTAGQLTLKFNATQDVFLSVPFSAELSFWKRLRVDFSRLRGIQSISVFYQLEGDPGFQESQMQRHRISDRNKYRHDFLLPPGTYTNLRIDFDGHRPDAVAVVTDIRLLDFSAFFYSESYFHLLAAAILALLILPGTMLYSLFTGRNRVDAETNLLLFFGLSIMFFLVLYGVLEASHRLAVNPHVSVGLSFLLILAVLAGLIVITNRQEIFRRLLMAEKKAFLSALALTLVCGVLVTGFIRTPFSFDSINWDTIDGKVIFSHFTGHDNMFQYVNGMAIADNDPFAKYYADGKLMASVQDREILAGVMYSVFRTLITSVSPYMGESYLTYTLIGMCMNIMVIFPLIVLLRRYFRNCPEYLFILLLSLNIFVLANYYFTWFKFAGAALFISGVLILFRNRKNFLAWLLAGIAFGLSANMHAGNALGIPLIFLLAIYLNWREDGFSGKTVLAWPILLCIVFILANAPWAIVKSLHFPDQHILFRHHYLPGSAADEGLLLNIINFFKTHPVQEQLAYRLLNLYEALRFSELSNFFNRFPRESSLRLMYLWSSREFNYFSIAVYPVLLIAMVSKAGLLCQSATNASAGHTRPAQPLRQEFTALLTMAFLTVGSLIFLSYRDHSDANYHLPMGIILIIHSLLIGFSLNGGNIGKILLLAYGCLSLWRIGSLFLHFLQ